MALEIQHHSHGFYHFVQLLDAVMHCDEENGKLLAGGEQKARDRGTPVLPPSAEP